MRKARPRASKPRQGQASFPVCRFLPASQAISPFCSPFSASNQSLLSNQSVPSFREGKACRFPFLGKAKQKQAGKHAKAKASNPATAGWTSTLRGKVPQAEEQASKQALKARKGRRQAGSCAARTPRKPVPLFFFKKKKRKKQKEKGHSTNCSS